MATIKLRRATERDIQASRFLLTVPLGAGLPHVDKLWEELEGYVDVLLGRQPSPIDSPYLTLAEVATAYYARALELDALIHALERAGEISRDAELRKFRTGELRSFIEMARKLADLGSRRLTQEQLIFAQKGDVDAVGR